jgi:hypothetical protein
VDESATGSANFWSDLAVHRKLVCQRRWLPENEDRVRRMRHIARISTVAADARTLDQRLHVLEVGVAAGEDGRLAARARGVWVLTLVQRAWAISNELIRRAGNSPVALAGVRHGRCRRSSLAVCATTSVGSTIAVKIT